MKKKIAAILLTGALALTSACGGSDNAASEAASADKTTQSATEPGSAETLDTEEVSSADPTEQDTRFSLENIEAATFDLESAADPAAFTGEGMKVSFVTDIDFEEPITGGDMASMCIYNNLDKIGAGDGSVVLQYESTRPTETGVTYYTFNQVNNYVRVYGACLKLIVDKDGKAIGLVSAVVPNLEIPDSLEANLTAEDAEAIVKEYYKAEGINVISGATEEVLLPAEEGSSMMYYAWVVYSRSAGASYDTAYTAHYISKSGAYLYALPVSEPGTLEAVSGNIAAFAFDGGTPGILNTTITYSDGETKDIEVPIMYDGETGEALLADPGRQILCADYAEYANNDTLVPIKCGDGEELVNSQITDYYHFIQVYDFFDEIGWTGPDGDGTPSLLLMNLVDENGEPVDNAFYQGKARGFQLFCFSDIHDYGETLDIMAHEFTHCLTSTTMTTNLYLNDAGAINEGMSDIIGNLVSILIEGYSERSWQIGDPAQFLRSMNDPHTHQQPEYVGDRYYLPAVKKGTNNNDNGGVHINSSLLNLISWYLDEAGMDPGDQLYFWMNVSLALTPRTDYPQMAALLPWAMETSGYPEYVSAVEDAVKKTRIGLGEDPQDVPQECGKVIFTYKFNEIENYDITVLFSDTENKEAEPVITWPGADTNVVSAVLPEGEYLVSIVFTPEASEDEGSSEESGEASEDEGSSEETSEASEDEGSSEETSEASEGDGKIMALYTEEGWYLMDYGYYTEVVSEYGSELDIKVEEGKVITLETDSLAAAIEE